MNGPIARILPDGRRLHLQHGPIDLVIGVEGTSRSQALTAATNRFDTILQELVDEQPVLRAPPASISPIGATAQRMYSAVAPHAKFAFITQMAAVAGAVADEILAAICGAGNISRAYVNNGGDIALHLARGQVFQLAMAGLDSGELGRITIQCNQNIGGAATSGRGGRSLTMGIADSVTVLAKTAAAADVAATVIANAVDLPHHRLITRAPARQIDPNSDLGERAVVTRCAPLPPDDAILAMNNGLTVARQMKADGLISGAALFLQGHCKLLSMPTEVPAKKLTEYA